MPQSSGDEAKVLTITVGEFKLILSIFSEDIKRSIPPAPIVLLTPLQAQRMLRVSAPTLNAYVKAGIIPRYQIGGATRYKQNEIEDALLKA